MTFYRTEFSGLRQCERCGKAFVPKYSYAKLCYDCWKRRQDAEKLLDEAEGEIDRLRQIAAEAEARAFMANRAEGIPPDMLKVLLLLCHPDRHGNSQASTKATQWLLQMRRSAA